MPSFGLDYLLQFCKIQCGQQIGEIEALGFEVLKDGTQMGHLLINCICHKTKKRFQISANVLNWKITQFQKGGSRELNYECLF